MRKIVSILLVVLLLINASGYYLISIGLSIHDKEQSLKLSNDEYSGSDAIIIKLPLSLPYSTNDDSYETADGKILFNNETYRIVKKRMTNDTVFIVCVRDQIEGKIRMQMNDLAKSQTDSPQNHKQASTSFSCVKVYLATSCSLGNISAPWTIEIGYRSTQFQYTYLFESFILQPPQA
jgi:hypothetical protein